MYRITNHAFFLAAIAMFLGACGPAQQDGSTATDAPAPVSLPAARPNIVIILTDDAGYSDIGAFGGEIETPNIDALARGGMRFNRFYSNARCSPTRASLLTGMYPARVGFAGGTLAGWANELPLPAYRGRLPSQIPTLAEILGDAGYSTLMAGKWHLGGSTADGHPQREALWRARHAGWENSAEEIELDALALPSRRGFDEYFGALLGEVPHFLAPGSRFRYMDGEQTVELEATGRYDVYGLPFPAPDSPAIVPNAAQGVDAFYDVDGVTDRAIRMVSGAITSAPATPFFLYLSYQLPHAPLQAERDLVDKYLRVYAGDDEVALRRQRIARLVDEGLLDRRMASLAGRLAEIVEPQISDERRRVLATHAAMIETLDRNIGRFVTALKNQGQLDNTLVFFLSDNGAAVRLSALANTPFRGGKGLLWEGGIRTHAIAHWPAVVPAGVTTQTVGWVGDLLPTVLAATGTAYPQRPATGGVDSPDGRSLLPTLAGELQEPPQTLFFNDRGQQAMLLQGRWKLLINPGSYENPDRRDKAQAVLYDLASDPLETHRLGWWHIRRKRSMVSTAEAWQKALGLMDYETVHARRAERKSAPGEY